MMDADDKAMSEKLERTDKQIQYMRRFSNIAFLINESGAIKGKVAINFSDWKAGNVDIHYEHGVMVTTDCAPLPPLLAYKIQRNNTLLASSNLSDLSGIELLEKILAMLDEILEELKKAESILQSC